MQSLDHRLWFSPSDLSQYLGCEHATRLSLEVARGTRPKIHATSVYATMIFKKGDDHEAAHLAHLRASGRDVVEVGSSADFAAGARRTEALMRSGADVIYQAPLVIDGWRGVADFLERVEGTTALGPWGYEAVDTKLARVEALPSHVLQLCFYSEGIERIQGESPRLAYVELGSGLREPIRLREVAAYFRRARAGFTTAIAADAPTEPFRCDHCDFCAFKRVCEERWRAEDSLVRVAGLRRNQIGLLRGVGVGTLTRLGSLEPDVAVPDIRRPTLTGLVQQARLQHEGEQAGTMPFELLELEVGRGFARLPEPSPGDVMFDLEGDPFWTPARELTFLFGMLVRNGERWEYVPFWGHTPEQERRAFERAIDLVTERLVRWPQLHVFHYSAAEPSAIRQLMATHATRELEVDDLLRRGVFVDLLAVVKQAMRVGVESYTLKQIEKLAGFERTAALASGSDAVLAYERWQTTRDQRELDAIAAYNEEDCRATGALYDWLLSVRPAAATWPTPPDIEPIAEEARAAQREREQLRGELIAGPEAGSERWFAGQLLSYHRREARPAWWRYFALRGLDDDALLADGEALTGLEPDGPRVAIHRSEDIRLRFPSQQHKIGAGAYDDENGRKVKVVSVDDAAGTVTIRRAQKRTDAPTPRTLLPGGPFDTGPQQDALLRFAHSVRDEDDRFAALKALVRRDPPRIAGLPPAAPIQTTDLGQQQRLARNLERSTLVVQGPPGTGKTHTGARLIVDLIRAGARVGVTALSHNAINNLVDEIELAADEADLWFVGARKTSADDKGAVTAGPNRR
ncbi:MAG: TM0106 family RecB-like putative nuclease, partial [Actinobacteria bacterium]|nr:TM0106 family RecB-like putative nuclease [Actinomycetota bacterium]